jgi:hypothetical protein
MTVRIPSAGRATGVLQRIDDYPCQAPRLVSDVLQSSNESYTWNHLFPEKTFFAFYHHPFTPDRAYLITPSGKFYTADTGRCTWYSFTALKSPNSFGAQAMQFHPDHSDWIIWTGDKGYSSDGGAQCHTEAYFSRHFVYWDRYSPWRTSLGFSF